MVTDPISDFIIRIKNASNAKKDVAIIPYSKFKFAIAHKLKDAGYIKDVTKRGKKTRKCVEIEIKYDEKGNAQIRGVQRVSKPGKRVYEPVNKIKSVKYGTGSLILSTPKGVLTDREAKKEKVGGEALFKIW